MTKTILILAANPTDTPPLRLDREVREINNGLERSQQRDGFNLKYKLAARPQDIRRAMLDYQPNIVHFCGHGSGEEGIAFENDDGQTKLLSTDALAGFFHLFADDVECVVLNACFSEIQANAIAKHIPYVIGMKRAIGDSTAIEFAVAFYDALGAGKNIEFAFNLACNAIQAISQDKKLIPVLVKSTPDKSIPPNKNENKAKQRVNFTSAITLKNAHKLKNLLRLGKGCPTDLAYSPDGKWLAVASTIGVHLYNVDKSSDDMQLIDIDHHIVFIGFTPDGLGLVSVSIDGIVRLWQLGNGALLNSWSSHIKPQCITISSDGTKIAIGYQKEICIWLVRDGNLLRTLEWKGIFESMNGSVTSIAFSPDDTLLASCTDNGSIVLWQVRDGTRYRKLDISKIAGIFNSEAEYTSIYDVVFSSENKTLAFRTKQKIYIYSMSDGKLVHILHEPATSNIVFNPDGTILVAGINSNNIKSWRTKDGMPLYTMQGHTGDIFRIAFHPDNKVLASISIDKTVREWQVNKGILLHTIDGYTEQMCGITFSSDNASLIVGAKDSMYLWRIFDGVLLRTFAKTTGPAIQKFAITPDGKIIATILQKKMRIWDASSGDLLCALEGHSEEIESVVFSPDGKILASSSQDGTVRLWGVL